MPFHSPEFLVLCVATFVAYYSLPGRAQHAVLFIGSLTFYAYAGLADTTLLLAVVALNHWGARAVEARRRPALIALVAFDLGVLAVFKYRGMLGASRDLIIPLGISFYVFQLIAYQVDLYRGQTTREPKLWRLLLYVLFFPHHQAGPIMRPAKFLPQFYGEKRFDPALAATGALWILWGLTKKVAADNIAGSVDPGFRAAASGSWHGSAAQAWGLAISYAAQIYGDFSGYSDIALGLGLLFGYELDRNFDQPYLATDPAQLWRRWHVTLSTWLRDYLYIPLGGNRLGSTRTYLNLMATMLLGGLWHGASGLFVLWGALHGALLALHRAVPALFGWPSVGRAITFGFTVAAWVPFRAESWTATKQLWSAMAGASGVGTPREILVAGAILGALFAAHWAEDQVLHSRDAREVWRLRWLRVPGVVRGMALAATLLAVVTFVVDRTTYIYFRF